MTSNDPLVLDGTLTIRPLAEATHPDGWWMAGALTAIETLAKTGRQFTAADLVDMGVAEPDHPNHWGSLLAKAKSQGLIRRVGYGTSRRAGRNGGVCATWQGQA